MLIEVMLAIAVFLLFVSVLTTAYLTGQESTVLAGNRARAILFAEEGLEAVRNIHDAGFSNLSNGTHGLAISANQWIFSGTQDTSDIFTRTIQISDVDTKRKTATSTVTWQQNQQRPGSVTLSTRLTNWKNTSNTPDCINQASKIFINTSNSELGGNNKELRGVTVQNTDASCDCTIDIVTAHWNINRFIEEIKIDSTKVWSKNGPGTPTNKQPSDTELNIQDVTLIKNSGDIDIDKFKFDGNMSGAMFTIMFTMKDGTTTSTASFSSQ